MTDQHMLSDRDRRDIQGLVLFGTTSPLLRYHFFQVTEPVAGRRFLSRFTVVSSALHVNTAGLRDKDARSESLVYVGFTWQGLAALCVSQVALDSFPEEFRQGAKARATLLGDDGASAPEGWAFDPDQAHVAVIIHARTNQCRLLASLEGQALPDFDHPSGQRVPHPVHFGCSDGISQPQILPAPGRHPQSPPAVPPPCYCWVTRTARRTASASRWRMNRSRCRPS